MDRTCPMRWMWRVLFPVPSFSPFNDSLQNAEQVGCVHSAGTLRSQLTTSVLYTVRATLQPDWVIFGRLVYLNLDAIVL